ncbi:MAG: outer membrane lipoprotein carrier protein LolA [Deltaproteobacteria bacterium]|nr:outer membrane lipoprotein carrier protein LolA [Deltaproteobacteria bacterium]
MKSTRKIVSIAVLVVAFGYLHGANGTTPQDKLTADFTMTRTLSVLSDSITSSGKLTLGGPGLLRWETTSPGKSVLIVNKNKAWIHYPDLGVTKNFDIGSDPVMKVLSEHLLVLTSGDLVRVAQLYKVVEQGKVRQLIPNEAAVRKVFREMRVELNGEGVATRVELVSTTGDTTTITFENIRLSPPLSRGLFSAPKSVDKSTRNR